MASETDPPAPAHRSVASIRAAPVQGQTPSTPHTPPRTIASTYGSPSTVRADDEVVVIELGSRTVRVGFAGDSLPEATLQCGLYEQLRVGDFRVWVDSHGAGHTGHVAWAEQHEIWRYDVRDLDLGLVQDKLDRLLREAFTKYLLIDSRPRRMALILDSALPLPLLSAALDTIFNNFQSPLISLLSSSTTCAVAAGVRSALVVDMGWAGTSITSLCEYREVKRTHTVRGGRHLLDELYRKLLRSLVVGDSEDIEGKRAISFEETEDILCRLMWCRPSASQSSQRQSAQLETVEEQDETETETPQYLKKDNTTHITLTSTSPPKRIEVSFERLADICDDAYFDQSRDESTFDDHDVPIHHLIYQHLLQLPIDVRAICMSRIIFTGGCSNILGIKERVLDEVKGIVEARGGWKPVTGKGPEQWQHNTKLQHNNYHPAKNPAASEEDDDQDTMTIPIRTGPAHAKPEHDPIENKIERHRSQRKSLKGEFRVLHSLGAWTGASLVCQLKVPALAMIDREVWVQHGINGASRPSDVDVKTQQRQNLGAGGLIRGSGGNHASWTLGAWGAT